MMLAISAGVTFLSALPMTPDRRRSPALLAADLAAPGATGSLMPDLRTGDVTAGKTGLDFRAGTPTGVSAVFDGGPFPPAAGAAPLGLRAATPSGVDFRPGAPTAGRMALDFFVWATGTLSPDLRAGGSGAGAELLHFVQ